MKNKKKKENIFEWTGNKSKLNNRYINKKLNSNQSIVERNFLEEKRGENFLLIRLLLLAFSTSRWIERERGAEKEREKEQASIEIHKARVVNRVCAEEHTAEACSCLTKTIIPAFLNRQDGIISVEEATAAIDARVESDKRG